MRLNGWHPFVATFHDAFVNKRLGQPLELFAMAEVVAEAHLHVVGVNPAKIDEFLSMRDQLLRNLANESGRKSALSVANALQDARNSPSGLEDRVCDAFTSLGFEVTPLGKPGQPDGVATAFLAPDDKGSPRQYLVSLEAKSKEKPGTKVPAKTVGISTIARQREKYKCDHALVVGPAFPTTQGERSALAQEINVDRQQSSKTITLIRIDDLAGLVRLRPVKQVGLQQVRELFHECRLPDESAQWVDCVRQSQVAKPPYQKIVEAIATLQRKFGKALVRYGSLRVELSHLDPPVEYETDEELVELCRGMAQMAPGAMFAGTEAVNLDQSAENVLAALDVATQDYPPDER